MPEEVESLLVRPMACTKEIMHLGWMLWKRSLRLEAVYKFWRMISKSTQLMSICSTVNRELQGTDRPHYCTITAVVWHCINSHFSSCGQLQVLLLITIAVYQKTRKPSYRWQTRTTQKHAKNWSNSTCLQRCRWQYWPIFIRLAVVASELCEIPRNSLKIKFKFMEFKVIQGHRSRCQLKAHMWLHISH